MTYGIFERLAAARLTCKHLIFQPVYAIVRAIKAQSRVDMVVAGIRGPYTRMLQQSQRKSRSRTTYTLALKDRQKREANSGATIAPVSLGVNDAVSFMHELSFMRYW
jgi:hypothetical protein